jgi:hypothetical protein
MTRSDWRFKLWESQGVPYKKASGYNVKFLGEAAYTTNRTNPDSDFDDATDGQELHGYNVMISWFEDEELKSMNKTIYGHPWGAYKQQDNSTYLDVDDDGITDIDEIDPWNSTTEAVVEFIEHFKNDQEMLDGQFNPFIRESTPPVVINIKVKTHEKWGWVTIGFIPAWVLKRAWAEIDLEVIDVAKFYVTVKISSDRVAEFEGEGLEWFKAELDLTFWELAGRYTVRVEMVDFAGNELDPPYVEEVDGWFGGVLRMLEALWDFICAVVSAIAEAVMAALAFLIDIILDMIVSLIQSIIDPIVQAMKNAIDGFLFSLGGVLEQALVDYKKTGTLSENIVQVIMETMLGSFFAILMGIVTVITVLLIALSPLPFLDLIVGLIVVLILTVILIALFGQSNFGSSGVTPSLPSPLSLGGIFGLAQTYMEENVHSPDDFEFMLVLCALAFSTSATLLELGIIKALGDPTGFLGIIFAAVAGIMAAIFSLWVVSNAQSPHISDVALDMLSLVAIAWAFIDIVLFAISLPKIRAKGLLPLGLITILFSGIAIFAGIWQLTI